MPFFLSLYSFSFLKINVSVSWWGAGLHQFKFSALRKHLLLQRYWKRKDFQNKTLRKWNAAPKNRLSQRLQCPSRTDVPRLCHALTAKATPSWAHGGATSSALCATNRCKAASIAVERGRNRHPLRLLSSCRPVKMIKAWGGGCHALSCKWPDNLHAFA